MSAQTVWQELFDIIAEVELNPFFELPSLHHYVVQYLKGSAIDRYVDHLPVAAILGAPDSFWDDIANDLLQQIRDNPSGYVYVQHQIKCIIVVDWWVNGKPEV